MFLSVSARGPYLYIKQSLLKSLLCTHDSLFVCVPEKQCERRTCSCDEATQAAALTQREASGVDVHLGEPYVLERGGQGKGRLHGDVTQQV